MPKVKLMTTMAGPKGAHKAGSVVVLPQEQAQVLVDGGFAEFVENDKAQTKPKASKPAKKEAETATKKADENAAKK